MARSRAKQGNRKHRVKVRNPDGSVMKDKRGRPITVGVKRYEPDKYELMEKRQKLDAFWQEVRDGRAAAKALEQEAAAQELVGA